MGRFAPSPSKYSRLGGGVGAASLLAPLLGGKAGGEIAKAAKSSRPIKASRSVLVKEKDLLKPGLSSDASKLKADISKARSVAKAKSVPVAGVVKKGASSLGSDVKAAESDLKKAGSVSKAKTAPGVSGARSVLVKDKTAASKELGVAKGLLGKERKLLANAKAATDAKKAATAATKLEPQAGKAVMLGRFARRFK